MGHKNSKKKLCFTHFEARGVIVWLVAHDGRLKGIVADCGTAKNAEKFAAELNALLAQKTG